MGLRWGGFDAMKTDSFKHFAGCAVLAFLFSTVKTDPKAGLLIAVAVGIIKEIFDFVDQIKTDETTLLPGRWDWRDSVLDLVFDIFGAFFGSAVWIVSTYGGI